MSERLEVPMRFFSFWDEIPDFRGVLAWRFGGMQAAGS